MNQLAEYSGPRKLGELRQKERSGYGVWLTTRKEASLHDSFKKKRKEASVAEATVEPSHFRVRAAWGFCFVNWWWFTMHL